MKTIPVRASFKRADQLKVRDIICFEEEYDGYYYEPYKVIAVESKDNGRLIAVHFIEYSLPTFRTFAPDDEIYVLDGF